MKTTFLVYLVTFCFDSTVSLRKDYSLEIFAIKSIIKWQKSSENGRVDLICCKNDAVPKAEIICRAIFKKTNSFSIKLESCDANIITLEAASVLIFDSFGKFNETYSKIRWKTKKWHTFRHLVLIENATITELENSEVNGWDIDNTAFLVNKTEKSIDLVTSFMFTENKCRQHQFATINRFYKKTSKWENDNFYPRKYRNFHKCQLTVCLAKKVKIESFDQIINRMSKWLKFKVDFIYHENFQNLYDLKDSHVCDFIRMPRNLEEVQFIFLTFESGSFFVPPGSPLNEIEKLLLPFESETWIAIVGTLTASFVIIRVITLLSKWAKDLCFGKNVNSPAMSMLSIFLCGGQTRVPRNSWARCIFLTFIFWSLIIRTCFQSLSYRALQLDSRHPSMKTLKDVQQSGFHQLRENKGLTSNMSFG